MASFLGFVGMIILVYVIARNEVIYIVRNKKAGG